MASKVALPQLLRSPEVSSTRPFSFMRPSAGSHTKPPWMSPRSQAATMSGGDMSSTSRLSGAMLNCSSANIMWKCVVEPKGTAMVLPTMSCGAVIESSTTSASASLILS